jgi:serine/threonine protein kinase/predicted ATPase
MAAFEPIRFGKYQLIEKIATGGMAEVYKAKSYGVAGFEKLLVIKKILPHLSRNPEFVKLFINEAKIAVSLNHANIVQVYDLGMVDADYYMAMEFIHGQDLMRVLRVTRKAKTKVPLALAVYIISEVSRGLDYAHHLSDPGGRPLNVVHQDVSPHNVLISYEGDVKLVDFGIARVGEAVDGESGKVAGGKMGYMAPEQAAREPVDSRSDIFSAGILLFELLTGQRAYKEKDPEKKRQMVLAAEIPSPGDLNPDIPPRLVEILLRSLSLDPQQRYQSAGELQEALLSLLHDEGLRSRRSDLAEFMKESFAADYRRESSGSVLNAIVRDLGELSRQADPTSHLDLSAQSLGGGPGSIGTGSGLSSRTSTPGRDGSLRQGQRRQVEVLTIEVTGLTDLVERVGEDALLRLHYSLNKRIAKVVRSYRGTVTRIDGDRLTVLWGLKRNSSRDGELCVRCASELLQMPARFARERKVTLSLSMGVHRGSVLVGGGRRRLPAYTAWGDTVKLANRLCQEADLNEVLVSEDVFGFVGRWCDFGAARALSVKWAAREVKAYRLLRTHRYGQREHSGRWVQRGTELDVLAAALEMAAAGTTVMVAIAGEAGSGKGRFLREVRRIAGERENSYFVGRGSFYRQETPFLAFREIVEQVCGFGEDDSPELQREKLQGLAAFGLDLIDVHILGQLFELSFEGSNLRYLSGDQLQLGTGVAIRRVFETLCERGGVILALQDFELLDVYSAELCEHLLEALCDRGLLMLVTHRPGTPLPAVEGVATHRLELPPMGRQESRAFVADALGVSEVPDELLELVVASAGGNALFAKEIVGQLLRQKLVVVEEGRAVLAGRLEDAEIPASAGDLIASRIDALSPPERVVLEVAGTCGRAFEKEILAEVTGIEDELLTPVLGRLEELKLLRPTRDDEAMGDCDYVFRNNLSWEVCCRGVLEARSREFHNRIGEAVERLKSANLRPYNEAVSVHYEQGGLLRRAAFFAEQAGLSYLRQYFAREALRCFRRALNLLLSSEVPAAEEREVQAHLAELSLRVAELLARDGRFAEADDAASRALEFAGEAEHERLQALALLRRVQAQKESGGSETGGVLLDEAGAIAQRIGDDELLTEVDEERARWAMDLGDFDEALESLQLALSRTRSIGHEARAASIYDLMGGCYTKRGDLERAREYLEVGSELAGRSEDRILQGRLLNNLGVNYTHMGELDEALRCFREALEIRKGIEYRRGVSVNLHNIGDLHFRMGDYDQAQACFEESLASARAQRWRAGEAMNLVYLGYFQVLKGALEEGAVALDSAIDLALSAGSVEAAAQGKILQANLLSRRGEEQQAEALLDEVRDLGAEFLVSLPVPSA